jgi:serpin B
MQGVPSKLRWPLRRPFSFLLWFGVGLVIALILILASRTTTSDDPIPFNSSADAKALVDGNTGFALDLYQKLKDQPGNLFCSPYSISMALAMTYAGAHGTTANEMARTLHFTVSQEKLPPASGMLTARMKEIQGPNRITLTSANSLWSQQGCRFTTAFLDQLRTGYDGESREVDFVRAPAAASGEINNWVKEKTAGKIKEITAPDQFNTNTRLVLCNAIYFKGKWQKPFREESTRPAPFHVSTNETANVPMMWQTARFKMAQSDDGAVVLLELPYAGGDSSMVILLPASRPANVPGSEPSDLPVLERKLTVENLREWLKRLDQGDARETVVALPRFTTAHEFELSETLKSLGMTSAFGPAADFSGMDGTAPLFISGVFHKAFVEVNEAGTEAAAATVVRMTAAKAMAYSFVADHPFIFLIRDNGSGAILFLGRIIDPTR